MSYEQLSKLSLSSLSEPVPKKGGCRLGVFEVLNIPTVDWLSWQSFILDPEETKAHDMVKSLYGVPVSHPQGHSDLVTAYAALTLE